MESSLPDRSSAARLAGARARADPRARPPCSCRSPTSRSTRTRRRLRAMHHHLGMLIEAVERGMSDRPLTPAGQARAARPSRRRCTPLIVVTPARRAAGPRARALPVAPATAFVTRRRPPAPVARAVVARPYDPAATLTAAPAARSPARPARPPRGPAGPPPRWRRCAHAAERRAGRRRRPAGATAVAARPPDGRPPRRRSSRASRRHRALDRAHRRRPGSSLRDDLGRRGPGGSAANGSSTTVAHAVADLHLGARLGLAAHQRQRDRAEPGRVDDRADPPDLALAERAAASPARRPAREAQPAQVAVRLALVVQARDGLLADVAALREAHRALVEAGLLRDRRVVEVDAVARAARSRRGRPRRRPRRPPRRPPGEPARARASASSAAQTTSTPTVGRDEHDGDAAALARALACSAGGGPRRGHRAGARPDQRQQPCWSVRLCSSASPADRAAADLVEQRLQRGALGVEPQLVAACRARAGRRASCPCWSAARRSSPCPASSASTSLRDLAVEELPWPRAPVSASLPRSERSTSARPGARRRSWPVRRWLLSNFELSAHGLGLGMP